MQKPRAWQISQIKVLIVSVLLLIQPLLTSTGNVGRQFEISLANTFVGNFNPPVSQELFDILEAQDKAMIKPDGIFKNLAVRSVSFVGYQTRKLNIFR